MKIQQAENGKWKIVIFNQALGLSRVYTFDTYGNAELFAQDIQADREERLNNITTINDYFRVGGN